MAVVLNVSCIYRDLRGFAYLIGTMSSSTHVVETTNGTLLCEEQFAILRWLIVGNVLYLCKEQTKRDWLQCAKCMQLKRMTRGVIGTYKL